MKIDLGFVFLIVGAAFATIPSMYMIIIGDNLGLTEIQYYALFIILTGYFVVGMSIGYTIKSKESESK